MHYASAPPEPGHTLACRLNLNITVTTGGIVANSAGGRPARSGRRARTIFATLGVVVALGLGITMFVGAAQQHGAAAQSSYTQAHGVRMAARVVSELTNTGKISTSALAVRLSGPVNGHDTTTVHIHGAPAYSTGATVTVVVDPQDPGYAELPGAPYSTTPQWVTDLMIGLGLILGTVLVAGYNILHWPPAQRRLRRLLMG
jgi:hypothetical protein